jgi:exopolyphosphatase/pppGpp-phosphohydrolase
LCQDMLREEFALDALAVARSLDFYNRHKHAAHFVLEADLSGFSHRDIAVLAAIVRSAEGDNLLVGSNSWPTKETIRRASAAPARS